MRAKAKKSRSITVRLSMRTFNDLTKLLMEQEEGGSKRARYQASLLRRRLDRAPRLNGAA